MRTSCALGLCLLLVPAAAGAGVEVTLFAGYRSGETAFPIEARIDPRSPVALNCFTTPCLLAEAVAEMGRVEPSLLVDVSISERWMAEALVTRRDGDLRLGHNLPAEILLARETYESTTAQVGLLRQWGNGRLRPYLAGALGATRLESTADAYDRPFFAGIAAVRVDEEVLSGSLAGGLKADLGRRIALRLEGRRYWHDLPERLGDALGRVEAGLGLAYRW